MAKVEGLTIIINGDATPFKRAMSEAKAEGTMLSRHLATVNKLIQFDPSSTVLLTRRQQLLNAALSQNAVHLSRLRQMNATYAANAASLTDAQRRQWMHLQRRMSEVELEYVKLRQQAIKYGAAASAANLKFNAGARGLQATLGKVSNQLLAVSAVTGLVAAASIKAAYEFESSFAGVRKTIIATEAEYENLARASREIALNKPISVNDVNRIMELGGQLNIASRYLDKFASVMADLDVSTDLGLEEGSLQLAQFMNITNMSQADVDRLGATIVDLGNNSATTEQRLMNMAMRIAGSGSNIGLSAQNVLALSAALSASGIQAEMGGNAISTIMNRIDKAVALNNSSLETWAATAGMTTEEFKYNWTNNVQDTLLAVIKGMGTFRDEGGNLNVLLKDMGISYMRQIDTMQRLSRTGKLVEELFMRSNTAWANNTALVREATQRYSTAESKVKMMGNAIYDAGITIGQAILPAFKDVVIGVTDVVQAFGKMDDTSRAAVVNIGAVMMSVGLAVKALESLSGGLGFLGEKFAQFKTWLVESAKGAAQYTEQTIVTTAAVTAETDAETVNGAAKLQAGAKTSIFTAAQQLLTASTWSLATALGVTNGMLLGWIAAAAAVGVAVGILVKQLDPMNQMTKATKEQAEQVDNARLRYEVLTKAFGAHSDEAVRAKAAYDDLELEYKENSETIGEMVKRLADVSKGLQEVREEVDSATAEADSDAGRILNTAASIEKLRDASDDASKMQLIGYIADLNAQVEKVDITMADAVEGTEAYEAALYEAQQAADKVRFDAAYEAFGTLSASAAEAETALEDLRNEYEWMRDDDYMSQLVEQYRSGQMSTDLPQYQQVAAYAALSEAVDDANRGIKTQQEIMRQTMDKTDAYEMAMRFASDANVSLEEACKYVTEEMGIEANAADVMAYKMQQARIETAESAAELQEMAEAIESLEASNPYLADLMADIGASATGLATYLQESGISVEDFAKELENMADTATDALNRIEVDSETTLYDLISNLNHNRDVMRGWGDDMAKLWDEYGNQGNEANDRALEYLASLGPEYANVVHQIVEGGKPAFEEFANAWGEAGEAGTKAGMDSIGASKDKMAAKAKEVADAINEKVRGGSNRASDIVKGGLNAQVSAYKTIGPRMVSSAASTFTKVGDSAKNVTKHSGSMYQWGYDMMNSFKRGIIAAKVIEYTNHLADEIKRRFHFSLPDEGPLREGGGPAVWMADMVDEMIAGLRSREDALSAQSSRIAWAVRSPLDNMRLGVGVADWTAAYPAYSRAAPYGGVYQGDTINISVTATHQMDENALAGAIADRVSAIKAARGRR